MFARIYITTIWLDNPSIFKIYPASILISAIAYLFTLITMVIDKTPLPELEMFLAKCLPGFQCCRCARCCQGKIIPLYPTDVERIEGKIKESFITPTSRDEEEVTGARYKMRMPGGRCIFLEGKSCRIYEMRPDTCRRHPFIVTGKNILVSSTCQGVDWDTIGKEEDYRGCSQNIAAAIDNYLERRRTMG